MKKTEKEALEFKRAQEDMISEVLEPYARQLILKKLGVEECGATVNYNEIKVFDWDHGTEGWIKDDSSWKEFLARFGKHSKNPNVVVITPWVLSNLIKLLSTNDILPNTDFGKHMEKEGLDFILHGSFQSCHSVRPSYKETHYVVELKGARWFELLTQEEYSDVYYCTKEERIASDMHALYNSTDIVNIELIPIKDADTEEEYEALAEVNERDVIKGAGKTIYQVRVAPKEGTLVSNVELYTLIGENITAPPSLKQGRELVGKITKNLEPHELRALVELNETNGNLVGAKKEIKEKISNIRSNLEELTKSLEYLEAGDFSKVDAAVAEVMNECMKLVAKKGLDPRIQKLATKIVQNL